MCELAPLWIVAGSCFDLGDQRVEVLSYEGQSQDVYYFLVFVQARSVPCPPYLETESSIQSRVEPVLVEPVPRVSSLPVDTKGLGHALLRVGYGQGALGRELELRDAVPSHGNLAPCWRVWTELQVYLGNHSPAESELSSTMLLSQTCGSNSEDYSLSDELEPSPAHGEDVYLEEEIILPVSNQLLISEPTLLLLTPVSQESIRLADFIDRPPHLLSILKVVGQICQFANYIYKSGWCLATLNLSWVRINPEEYGVQFTDCTGVYKSQLPLPFPLTADYCAPELSYSLQVDEKAVVYSIAALTEVAINHLSEVTKISASQSPGFAQILKVCQDLPEYRLELPQFLRFLTNYSYHLSRSIVTWQVAHRSTLGLSRDRLENEDNWVIRQGATGYPVQTYLIGVVADGMGGLAQGELASKVATQVFSQAQLPMDNYRDEQWDQWLCEVTRLANQKVYSQVPSGGTTLSVILAVNQKLWVNHLGDSRISLIRNGQECQLSEDHSWVRFLFNNGQIQFNDMENHRDRNTLIKSLGSKKDIDNSYIHRLGNFDSQSLALELKSGDLLLLYSDGVWDLIKPGEMIDILNQSDTLQKGVNQIIQQVIIRGAPDNATLIALQCHLDSPLSL